MNSLPRLSFSGFQYSVLVDEFSTLLSKCDVGVSRLNWQVAVETGRAHEQRDDIHWGQSMTKSPMLGPVESISEPDWTDALHSRHLSISLIIRALAFATGAAVIGFAVVPTEMLLISNALPSQIVIARLAWGALTLLVLCLVFWPHTLRKSLRQHGRLCLVGLMLGWATTELYTRALDIADVLPVIVLLVAASAVTGMVLQLGARLQSGHLFVLLAVLVSVGATVQASSPGFELSGTACAFALGAGIIYGALPVLCRNAGQAPDVAAVFFYLSYGTFWAVLFLGISDPSALRTSVDVVLSVPGVVAGALCTGLGYALFQVGISPDITGQRIGSTWAGLLFGFEPITAIAAAGLFLGQTLTVTSAIFAIAFVALVGLAGPTLSTLNHFNRE